MNRKIISISREYILAGREAELLDEVYKAYSHLVPDKSKEELFAWFITYVEPSLYTLYATREQEFHRA